MSDDKKPKNSLYHYTNKKGADAIKESGMIKASEAIGPVGRDAVYGRGVYATSHGPETKTEKLVANNWDDVTPTKALMEKRRSYTSHYVKVDAKDFELKDAKRGVYFHEGDLELGKNPEIYQRNNSDK